jgi:hypothetical protein
VQDRIPNVQGNFSNVGLMFRFKLVLKLVLNKKIKMKDLSLWAYHVIILSPQVFLECKKPENEARRFY